MRKAQNDFCVSWSVKLRGERKLYSKILRELFILYAWYELKQ